MKNGFAVFSAVLVALGASWLGFVVAPIMQLGTAKQVTVLNSSDTYPLQRTGNATRGLQVYRANGCAACHTEQVRQDNVICNVFVTSLGKNSNAVWKITSDIFSKNQKLAGQSALRKLVFDLSRQMDEFGSHVWEVSKNDADADADKITAAGGKVEIHIVPIGADISRGWGIRQSVAADYLYDYPVQLGSLRAGPDLSNIGARDPDLNWQLVHLYAPQALVKGSAMPPFRFLFEVRKIGDAPSSDALQFPKDFAPPAGCEVVPKPEAKQLASYLLSLRQDAPLYEAPFTPVMAKP